jgi:predicted Fe-Mo cluster-binding NifX family protein
LLLNSFQTKRTLDFADGRRIQMRKARLPKHIHRASVKSHGRASPAQAPVASSSGTTGSSGNRQAAVPVFMGRVSPVLDTCTQLILIEPDGKQGTARRTIHITGASIFERAGQLHKLGIGVIICGTVSDAFYNLLREAGVDLICGIAGDIEDIIEAYCSGSLDMPRFRMPGFD